MELDATSRNDGNDWRNGDLQWIGKKEDRKTQESHPAGDSSDGIDMALSLSLPLSLSRASSPLRFVRLSCRISMTATPAKVIISLSAIGRVEPRRHSRHRHSFTESNNTRNTCHVTPKQCHTQMS